MSDTPLDFLCAVYRNEELPLSVRMRAAQEAAPYMHAKLGAIAIGSMNNQDFASLLEKAIARSNRKTEVKLIEGHAIASENEGSG